MTIGVGLHALYVCTRPCAYFRVAEKPRFAAEKQQRWPGVRLAPATPVKRVAGADEALDALAQPCDTSLERSCAPTDGTCRLAQSRLS
jgi:hypothetical protein